MKLVSVINTLPAPVVQMGYVEKIVEMQQNQPYVQQLVAGESAAQSIRKEKEQVAVMRQGEGSGRVRERSAGENRESGRNSEGDKKKEKDDDVIDVEARLVADGEICAAALASGSLIDIKI